MGGTGSVFGFALTLLSSLALWMVGTFAFGCVLYTMLHHQGEIEHGSDTEGESENESNAEGEDEGATWWCMEEYKGCGY